MTSPNPHQTSKPTDREQSEKNVRVLRLPDESLLESRVVERTLRFAISVFVALVVTAILAATLIHMDVAVDALGTLEPIRVTPVRTPITGIVREVRVNSGDRVLNGDTLALLEDADLLARERTLELAIAEGIVDDKKARTALLPDSLQVAAMLDAAASRLIASRAQLQRRAVDYGLAGNVDSLLGNFRPGLHIGIDEAVAAVKAAQAEVRLAEAKLRALALHVFDSASRGLGLTRARTELAEARSLRQRHVLLAPTEGVVSTDDIERLFGALVRQGDALFDIADESGWRVIAHVGQADVSGIAAGQRSVVEVDAVDLTRRRRYEGRVAYVASDTSTNAVSTGRASRLGMYRVVIALDSATTMRPNASVNFRRGFSARAKIISYSDRAHRVILYKIRRSFVP